MGMKFTNFATSTLASGITNVATSLSVFAGDGGKFPTLGAGDYFYAVLENLAGTREIIKVTARTGDSFGTIVRAQDGTTNLAWNAGDKIELRVVNANVSDFPKLDEANTFTQPQTFGSAPITSTLTGILKGAGASPVTTATTGVDYLDPTADKVQGFRLTLTTGTPVTTADVATATTIYCTPYKGNTIALYTGTAWVVRTSAEFSLALGTLTSGLPYDVFCFDNAGTPTLEFLAWTNTTTRATALTYQDGILVKTGAATRRYMGTFYTISTTQTADSSIVGRYLFNYYNRTFRPCAITDATFSWSQTAGVRQANASTANQFNFVVGVEENPVEASVAAYFSNGTGGQLCTVDIGLDSTSVSSATVVAPEAPAVNIPVNVFAWYKGFTGIGKHALVWLENTGGGTTTWYGTSAPRKSGMTGGIWG